MRGFCAGPTQSASSVVSQLSPSGQERSLGRGLQGRKRRRSRDSCAFRPFMTRLTGICLGSAAPAAATHHCHGHCHSRCHCQKVGGSVSASVWPCCKAVCCICWGLSLLDCLTHEQNFFRGHLVSPLTRKNEEKSPASCFLLPAFWLAARLAGRPYTLTNRTLPLLRGSEISPVAAHTHTRH